MQKLVQIKNIQIWDQKYLSWVFLGYNFENLLSYLKSKPSNMSKCKYLFKQKKLQIWDEKFLIWVILGCNFKKLLSYLKSALSNLSECFVQKVSYKKKNP